MDNRPTIRGIVTLFVLAAFVTAAPTVALLTSSVAPIIIGLALLMGSLFAIAAIGLIVDRREQKSDGQRIEALRDALASDPYGRGDRS